ncbi:MAG TPA: hypothetical protein VFZ79_09010 [Acidimicrobiales bacterium]
MELPGPMIDLTTVQALLASWWFVYDRGEADFRSYLFATHVAGSAVSSLSSGVVLGTVRADDGGAPRFADLRVVLDFTDPVTFTDATRHGLA